MKAKQQKAYVFVKNLKGYQGIAKLWKIGNDYFVTSYVCNGWAHETMMFAADNKGKVSSFSDLACVHGCEAHEECLEDYIAYKLQKV